MVRSVLTNWGGVLVSAVLSFLLMPFLIHRLGVMQYGMWALAGSVLDYYGVFDLGIRTTLQRYVGRLKGADARDGLNEVLSTALAISLAASAVSLCATLAIGVLLPGFVRLSGAAQVTLQHSVFLLGLSCAIQFPARLFGAYLCGLERFDLYNLGTIISEVVRAALLVVVLYAGRGLVAASAVTLCAAGVSLVLNWVLLRIADKQAVISVAHVNPGRARELVTYGWFAFLSTAGDYLRFYTDSLVISRVLTVASVTPFSVAARLMAYLRLMMSGIAGPLMSRMSGLHGREKNGELERLFLRGTHIVTFLTVFAFSLLFVNGRQFLKLWLGSGFGETYALLTVLMLGYVLEFAQLPSVTLLYAAGRHRPLGMWTLAEGAANCILSIYWGRTYGLIGVAFGTAVPMLLSKGLVQPWYVLRVLGMPLRTYITETLARPAIAGAIFLAICWPQSTRPGDDLWSFMFGMAWQVGLFIALSLSVGVKSADRQVMVGRAKALLRRGGLRQHKIAAPGGPL